MPDLNPQLQAVIADSKNLTAEQAAQLRTAITQDTQLRDRLNADAAAGHLSSFALAAPDAPSDCTQVLNRHLYHCPSGRKLLISLIQDKQDARDARSLLNC